MKKIVTILLLAALSLAVLTACGNDAIYDSKTATAATEEATEAVSVNAGDYEKTFDGMQDYLIDCKLLQDTTQKEKTPTKSDTYAEILGAKNGVRYTLSSSVFIEFYEYTEENDISKQVFEQVRSGGVFSIAGLDELTGVLSDSGNFLAVYNASINYNYDSIIEAFRQF